MYIYFIDRVLIVFDRADGNDNFAYRDSEGGGRGSSSERREWENEGVTSHTYPHNRQNSECYCHLCHILWPLDLILIDIVHYILLLIYTII